MLAIGRSIVSLVNACHNHLPANKSGKAEAAVPQRTDFSENLTKKEKQKLVDVPLKLSKGVVVAAQSAIGILALGFIDAGYSGDWSRIGVISKEEEDLLKSAAFSLSLFCICLIFSLSKNKSQD